MFGFALIFIGISAVIVGSVETALSATADVSTGIVVFIGPIPIVFGSGREGGTLALIALVGGIGMILLFYLHPFLAGRRRLA
jgi:uncharacterized membrane protein